MISNPSGDNSFDVQLWKKLRHCANRHFGEWGVFDQDDLISSAWLAAQSRGNTERFRTWKSLRWLLLDARKVHFHKSKPTLRLDCDADDPLRLELAVPATQLADMITQESAMDKVLTPEETSFMEQRKPFDILAENETRQALGGTPMNIEDMVRFCNGR